MHQRHTIKRTYIILYGVLSGLLLIAPPLWAGPLHDAAEINDTARIKQLINKGNPIGEVDTHGIWPLLAATSSGSLEAVELLLELGANPNQADQYAYTALHEASSLGYRDIVDSLIGAKADMNARDVNGITPLEYALRSGNPDTVELLQNLGALQ